MGAKCRRHVDMRCLEGVEAWGGYTVPTEVPSRRDKCELTLPYLTFQCYPNPPMRQGRCGPHECIGPPSLRLRSLLASAGEQVPGLEARASCDWLQSTRGSGGAGQFAQTRAPTGTMPHAASPAAGGCSPLNQVNQPRHGRWRPLVRLSAIWVDDDETLD